MPDKLLTAMDIMDRLTDNWIFLPGLNSCCGGNHDTAGYLEAGQTAMNGLTDSFHSDRVEAIVLWCPTCVTRFHLSELDLPTISFARFAADRIADLKVTQDTLGPITLHDPCKIAFFGIDPVAPRELLNHVTGSEVLEMPRHGSDNMCCGYGVERWAPEAGRRWIHERVPETLISAPVNRPSPQPTSRTFPADGPRMSRIILHSLPSGSRSMGFLQKLRIEH